MAITAGVVGGAMVVGGTAAAVRAMRMKTKPRGVQYGGSQGTLQGYREMYGQGVDRGAVSAAEGLHHVGTGAERADALTVRGAGIMDSAENIQNPALQREGMALLKSYQPGAVAEAQARQVLDQNAQANLGAARSGGALAMRNAVNANAMAGVRAAADSATQRAAEEQAYVQVLAQQANRDEQAQLEAEAVAEQQRVARLGLGSGIISTANQQQIGAGSAAAEIGAGQERTYLTELSGVNQAQLAADLDYERRRQADAQRRANNLWNLGSSLIGGGARAIGGGAG